MKREKNKLNGFSWNSIQQAASEQYKHEPAHGVLEVQGEDAVGVP